VLAIAYLALYGWIPAVVAMFALMPVRRAATIAVIGAWLLLPPYQFSMSNFPDYSKVTAASLGLVFGTLFFGIQNVLSFRPRWFDVPMVLWCFINVASSLSNGLGIYDGLAQSLTAIIHWGLPYYFGRLYFGDGAGLRTFTVGIAVGGLACVLPCLWEMRMSPHLLGNVYGWTGWEGTRWGGYRPRIFFRNGLELGMWMTAVSVTAWWLWRCSVIKRLGQWSFGTVVLPILLGTTILCRSTGALVLLAGGMLLLWASVRFKTKRLFWALVLFGPIYVVLRVPNLWSGENLVGVVAMVSWERAHSLEYRFKCENLLIAQAIKQPVFGWGGWNRGAAYSVELAQDVTHLVPADGLWISVFGTNGLVGLSLLYTIMELPVIFFLLRFSVDVWRDPRVAPATVAATLLAIYMIDCLVNSYINIVYVTLAGGLAGITPMQCGIGSAMASPMKHMYGRAAGVLRRTAGNELPSRVIVGSLPDQRLPEDFRTRVAVVDQYQCLGRSLKSERRWADAYSAWKQAFELLTDLTVTYSAPWLERRLCDCANDLAWLLLGHPDLDPRGPAYALSLAMQIVNRCSDDGAYWNTLGVAYFRNGDVKAAIVALNRAVSLAGEESPFNYVFLALACAHSGDGGQARHWLVKAIRLKEQTYPNHAELACFCDEACAVLGTSSEAVLTVV
jgi:hypothetical protein